MKQKAMDVKLVVRPLIGCLTHTHFWEEASAVPDEKKT